MTRAAFVPAVFLLILLPLRLAGAQAPTVSRHDRRYVALGVSLGAPSGGGVVAEVQPLRHVWIRGIIRGWAGTVPRGIGVALDVLSGRQGRLTLSGGAGDMRCVGDRDGVCSGAPLVTGAAYFAGVGGDFPIADSGAWSIGVDIDRWVSQNPEFPSMYTSSLVLRAYF